MGFEIREIGNRAIKNVTKENRELGIPLVFSKNGTIYYELPNGDEELDVRFTIVEPAKDDIEKILDIPIENAGDYLVPLRDIVDVKKTVTPNSIERKDYVANVLLSFPLTSPEPLRIIITEATCFPIPASSWLIRPCVNTILRP